MYYLLYDQAKLADQNFLLSVYMRVLPINSYELLSLFYSGLSACLCANGSSMNKIFKNKMFHDFGSDPNNTMIPNPRKGKGCQFV